MLNKFQRYWDLEVDGDLVGPVQFGSQSVQRGLGPVQSKPPKVLAGIVKQCLIVTVLSNLTTAEQLFMGYLVRPCPCLAK